MSSEAFPPTDTEALRATAAAIFPGRSSGSYAVPPWMQDIVVAHGAGSRFYTTAGDGYLDYILGSGPLILGHAHPRVVACAGSKCIPLFPRQKSAMLHTFSYG
jgi:glutamate-1-semialdehyde 2,1-aminomutase